MLILSKWQPFFAWVPVESLIHDHQEGYYNALAISDSQGESTVFIQFMLEIIREALGEVAQVEEKDLKKVALTLITILPLRLNELRATPLPVLCSVPLSNTLYHMRTENSAAPVFIHICAGAAPAW